MLEYSEITPGRYIEYEGEPYEVLSYHVFRKQQRKPVNATKLKHLITGSVKEVSFHQSEKVNEAEVLTREIKYLYNNKGEWWFSEVGDPSKRFKLTEEAVGTGGKFLKQNSVVEIKMWGEKMVGLKLPIKNTLSAPKKARSAELRRLHAEERGKEKLPRGSTSEVFLTDSDC
ncbi:MAG: elongation factor P [Parcubacteria group bacterium Gr01-1014_72]|nr:MAG: elongation factor P [Parcubacteria group bacterium Gr01-1014_72]